MSDFVSLCLCFHMLPVFPCPYLAFLSQFYLLVQLVPAVCVDYVPGVSRWFCLIRVCSALKAVRRLKEMLSYTLQAGGDGRLHTEGWRRCPATH